MKYKSLLFSSGLILSALFASAPAQAVVDNNAAQVLLRSSCTENGATIDNCFDDLNTLNTWIWNTRYPSPVTPLNVEVGPGTFTGQFSCTGSGFVSIHGAGMGNTVIQNSSSPISTTQCVNLVFADMTLKNTGNLFGVRNAGGTTVWHNVEIIGLGYAWFDTPGGCSGAPGTHYWFGSRITAETSAAGSTTAYFNACDHTWFYGSEITAKGSAGNLSTPLVAVGGEVHVYGSNIRALPESGAVMNKVTAVTATNTAEIHIHGTGIDVISDAANDIVALDASNGGTIHANESSYVMKTGSGTKTRVLNNGGNIMAPYQWQVDATPPAINSVSGYDTVIYTSTGDGHPHFAVYDSSCPGDWYDINTSSCL